MANNYSLIYFRRDAGVWWDNTSILPSGQSNKPHGKMSYGTSGTPNYLVSGGVNTFNQGSITDSNGKAEPWVNTLTKQMFIGSVCINPEVSIRLNGAQTLVPSSMTFDSNYKVFQEFDLNISDQYLQNVTSRLIPALDDSNGDDEIAAWIADLLNRQTGDFTVSQNAGKWVVEWDTDGSGGGSDISTAEFNPNKNYLGFAWALSEGVTTPTFVEIPDSNTDTTYDLIVGNSENATANTTSALLNGQVYLNLINTSNNTVQSSHSITGGDLIEVVTDNQGNITINHTTSDSSAENEIEASLTGNILNVPTITYDDWGHIIDASPNYIALPTGGGSGSHTFSTNTAVQRGSTGYYYQGKVNETHTAEEQIAGVNGSLTTVTIPSGYPVQQNDKFVINNTEYNVDGVSNQQITISPALPSAITNETITWKHSVTNDIIRVQKDGVTSSNLSTYDGSLITFKMAGAGQTATGSDENVTLLVSIDIIDGGVFD